MTVIALRRPAKIATPDIAIPTLFHENNAITVIELRRLVW
jgi:hypothetical protein